MWNKLSFIFVTFVSSTILVPSIHFFLYLATVFSFPFILTFCDIVSGVESINNIPEALVYNHINASLGRATVEARAEFISFYKVMSLIISLFLGIINAISLTRWLFSF